MQKYSHIIESFACVLVLYLCHGIFAADKFLNFFWNMSKDVKIGYIVTINI